MLPVGLEDVSKYPHLIAALIEKGYKDDAIKKVTKISFLKK